MRLTLYPNGLVWVTSSLDQYQPSLVTSLGKSENASILQLNLPSSVDPESLVLVDMAKAKLIPIKHRNLASGQNHLTLRLWIPQSVSTAPDDMALMFLEKLPLSWHVSYRGVLCPQGNSLSFEAVLYIQNSGNRDIGPAEVDIIVKDMPAESGKTGFPSHQLRKALFASPSHAHFEMAEESEQESGGEEEYQDNISSIGSSSFEGGSKICLPEPVHLLRGTVSGVPLLKTGKVPLKKRYYWLLQSRSESEQIGPARLDYRFSAVDHSRNVAQVLPGGTMQLLSHEFEPIGSFHIPKVMPVSSPVAGDRDSPSDIVIRNQTDDRVRVSSLMNEKTIPIPGKFPSRLQKDLFATILEGEATVANHHVAPIEIQLRVPISQTFIRKVQVSQGNVKWNPYKKCLEITLGILPNRQERTEFLVVTDNWERNLGENVLSFK